MTARLGIVAQQKQIGASELLIGEGGLIFSEEEEENCFLMSHYPIVSLTAMSIEHGKRNTKSSSDAYCHCHRRRGHFVFLLLE